MLAALAGACVDTTEPESDPHSLLLLVYHAMGGPEWIDNRNWATDAPVERWYGVTTAGPHGGGDVVWLELRNNGLVGSIPPELGNLGSLKRLDLGYNQLSGIIPRQLGRLRNLQELNLRGNELIGPIPPEFGNLDSLRMLDLGYNQLSRSIPRQLGSLANLYRLYLDRNKLSGPIPPELDNLDRLVSLYLNDNQLSGPIPPQLGNLAYLSSLYLNDNQLSGPIPPELGNLAYLSSLYLNNNQLSGPIPPQLGNFANLFRLYLGRNQISGPVPPELGNLRRLDLLSLDRNNLTGPVPAEFGLMSGLRELTLSHNERMAGPLPAELTSLPQLDALVAGGTALCAPVDPDFQSWLEGVYKRRIATCGDGEPPTAYLTQAVQSREWPVPLVAGEKALLRVFVTARRPIDERIPRVLARFYLDGIETHEADIPGKAIPVPTEVDESSILKSSNAEIPAVVVKPGLEMVIWVDPEGTLDEDLLVSKRIPETGRLALDVQAMPVFDLTVIPFVWSETHDSSIVDLVGAMAADPDNHEMLQDTRTLLPIGDLEVTAHAPVLSTSNNACDLLYETSAIRAMEGGTGYYKGMMSPPVTGGGGVAYLPGWASFSRPSSPTLAHELGHNLYLRHAPCGGAGGPDPSYPYRDGSIGVWGYDFRDGGMLVEPSAPDMMSYCEPEWISGYYFTNALRYRLLKAQPYLGPRTRSLLLWGGVGADSVPFLEPAFVVEASPTLPQSAGEYRLTGRSPGGAELFALAFAMPEVADGDGSSSFAFTIPVHSGWEDRLATITLSGPGGSATLDADSDLGVAILRDPRNGQVRAILRDVPEPDMDRADPAAALGAGPGLRVLFSRGIPDGAAWRR